MKEAMKYSMSFAMCFLPVYLFWNTALQFMSVDPYGAWSGLSLGIGLYLLFGVWVGRRGPGTKGQPLRVLQWGLAYISTVLVQMLFWWIVWKGSPLLCRLVGLTPNPEQSFSALLYYSIRCADKVPVAVSQQAEATLWAAGFALCYAVVYCLGVMCGEARPRSSQK